ncbi:MAG: hypothetical protein RLZZ546_1005 [Bacteroidota bacterium]|jgi:two-component system LytT family response regulator
MNQEISKLINQGNIIKLIPPSMEDAQNFDKLIPFPDQNGIQYIKASTILFLKSESNYTHVYFTDDRKLLLSKTLKVVNGYLPSSIFVRIHKSYVINKEHVVALRKNTAHLVGNVAIPLSRSFDKTLIIT